MTTLSAPISPTLTARRPLVRPWAIAGPILILLLCLPMLRPLRHPAELPAEEARLVDMVRQNLDGRLYVADRPPVSLRSLTEPSPTFALVLTGPAWLLDRMGFDFEDNPTLMAYLLIAVGVTLPVALSAGIIYRMARVFELNRPQRAALGLLCVAGTGLASYATTLSAQALSATLLIGGAAMVLQALRSARVSRGVLWAPAAGAAAMLAAALDPSAVLIAALMPVVFLAWRVNWACRLLAVLLFLAAAVPPLWLHRTLHGAPSAGPLAELAAQPPILAIDDASGEPEAGLLPWLGYHTQRLVTSTVGSHGLLSHFPLLLLGAVGASMLMHRNWPEAVKWMAAATILGGVVGVVAIVLSRIDFTEAGYATRWFVVFSPLLLFWSGAWLKRVHGPGAWAAAAVLAAFSVTVTLIGAARPAPPQGYRGYTAASALRQIIHPPPARLTFPPPTLPPSGEVAQSGL